jgi:hypothetical protein
VESNRKTTFPGQLLPKTDRGVTRVKDEINILHTFKTKGDWLDWAHLTLELTSKTLLKERQKRRDDLKETRKLKKQHYIALSGELSFF